MGFGVPGELDPGIGLAGVPLPPTDPVQRDRRASGSIDAPAPAVPTWDDSGVGAPADGSPEAPGWYFLTERPGIEERPTHRAGSPVQPRPQFDLHAVRRDFPILSERVNGKQLVWLDNAATTQKPQVGDRPVRATSTSTRTPTSTAPLTRWRPARPTPTRAPGTPSPGSSGADADGDRLRPRHHRGDQPGGATAGGDQHVGEGDEIVDLPPRAPRQHRALAAAGPGARLHDQGDPGGRPRAAACSTSTRGCSAERTKLVSVTQVSNALGHDHPGPGDRRRRPPARCPGRWSTGRSRWRTCRSTCSALDVDFFVFSGHKIFAPTGIGALYGKRTVLGGPAALAGRRQHDRRRDVRAVTCSSRRRGGSRPAPATSPTRSASARPSTTSTELGLPNIAQYEHELLTYATDAMLQVPGLTMIGTAAEKASVLSFVLDGYSTSEVGEALSRRRHRRPVRPPLRPADPAPVRAGDHRATLAGAVQHPE